MGEKEYVVYLHINKLNNKVYVGITKFTTNPNIRWADGRGYKYSIKFKNAIAKYRWNTFKHIVICKTNKRKAVVLETSLIAYYKRKDLSYNIANGGEGSSSVSEETKSRLSRILKGKVRNKESVHRAVETRKRLGEYTYNPYWLWNNRDFKGEKNPMYGKKHTEEALRKKYKRVLQYNKNNELIAEYESVKEAAKAINKSCTHVVSALRGRSKTAGGYIWRYKI